MRIKGKFLIDYIDNELFLVYNAHGVQLLGFRKLYDNEQRIITLENNNKLQFLDTQTGEMIPQKFNIFLKKYTNDYGSLRHILENNHALIMVTVY